MKLLIAPHRALDTAQIQGIEVDWYSSEEVYLKFCLTGGTVMYSEHASLGHSAELLTQAGFACLIPVLYPKA